MKYLKYILSFIAIVIMTTLLVLVVVSYSKEKIQGSGSYYTAQIKLLDGVTTSTASIQRTTNYKHAVCALDTTGNATATIKFYGSITDSAPDVTASASSTNQYDYIQVTDLENGASIDGDTGITLSGTDDNRMVEFDTNLLGWAGAYVSSYTTGTINLTCKFGDNQ